MKLVAVSHRDLCESREITVLESGDEILDSFGNDMGDSMLEKGTRFDRRPHSYSTPSFLLLLVEDEDYRAELGPVRFVEQGLKIVLLVYKTGKWTQLAFATEV